MPAVPPEPPPFEPEWLRRSLDRYLIAGIVFMVALIACFAAYRVHEPSLRADAKREQHAEYRVIGEKLYRDNCASCHGDNGEGDEGPALNAKEFLEGTSDEQIRVLTSGGVSGTDMAAWGLDFGGALTDEQIRQIVTHVRSWQPDAPSVPDWRNPGSGEPHDTTNPTN